MAARVEALGSQLGFAAYRKVRASTPVIAASLRSGWGLESTQSRAMERDLRTMLLMAGDYADTNPQRKGKARRKTRATKPPGSSKPGRMPKQRETPKTYNPSAIRAAVRMAIGVTSERDETSIKAVEAKAGLSDGRLQKFLYEDAAKPASHAPGIDMFVALAAHLRITVSELIADDEALERLIGQQVTERIAALPSADEEISRLQPTLVDQAVQISELRRRVERDAAELRALKRALDELQKQYAELLSASKGRQS